MGGSCHADLAVQGQPPEGESGAGVPGEFGRLLRLGIGEERHSVVAQASQQHVTGAWCAVGRDRGKRHRVGLVHSSGDGLLVPLAKLRHRLLGEVGQVKTLALVLPAKGSEVHDQQSSVSGRSVPGPRFRPVLRLASGARLEVPGDPVHGDFRGDDSTAGHRSRRFTRRFSPCALAGGSTAARVADRSCRSGFRASRCRLPGVGDARRRQDDVRPARRPPDARRRSREPRGGRGANHAHLSPMGRGCSALRDRPRAEPAQLRGTGTA